MKETVLKVICVLLLMLTLSLSSFSNASGKLKFKNFDRNVSLVPTSKLGPETESVTKGTYRFKSKLLGRRQAPFTVQVAHRLIVKVDKRFNKESLKQTHVAVSGVSSLFEMQSANYFLLDLSETESLAKLIKFFAKLDGVYLVQPDILQLKQAAQTKPKQHDHKFLRKAKGEYVPPVYIEQLSIEKLWQESKGRGVKIAVIDDGFDLSHADLRHVKPVFAYDLHSQTLDAQSENKEQHGSKVLGVIFANHRTNDIKGIAPRADLIALRHVDTWTSKTLISFNLAKLAEADIINASWHSQMLLEPVADVVNDLAQHGREGKGVAVVFAAGNQAKEILPLSIEGALEKALVVGASDNQGQLLPFSSYGDSVDAYLYGGNTITTGSKGEYIQFGGTSLSAAVASGYLALLLSKDPSLSLQDLNKQLVQAAKPISDAKQ